MAKTRMTMAKRIKQTSFDLPTDLIFNILSRLPVKALIRLKTVCKTWYALIENPYFGEQHQKLQTTRGLEFTFSYMLLTASSPGYKLKSSLLYFNDASHKLIKSKSSYLSNMRSCMVVGICNGLVCVCSSFRRPKFIICNPTTRQFRKITPAKLPRKEGGLLFLGFVSYVNDYEIIRIVCPSMKKISSNRIVPVLRGELYTKGFDTWREFEVKLGESSWLWRRYYNKLYYTKAVVINAVFYWKSSCYDNLCVPFFDMRKRVLDVIEPPQEASTSMNSQLRGIKDELALITCKKNRFVMWVLDEDMTWTKMHTIDIGALSSYPIRDGVIRVLGSTRRGELVLVHRLDNNLRLFSYDIDSQDMKCLHNVDVDVAGFSLYTAYLYPEALTPVN